jgi:hypothetical protein
MMKSAKDRPSGHLAEPLGWPMGRRILVQGQMCPGAIVIGGIGSKHPVQMGFTEDHDMIEAIPADRAINLSACPFCQGDRAAVG